jgi:hypothetical protein
MNRNERRAEDRKPKGMSGKAWIRKVRDLKTKKSIIADIDDNLTNS